MKVEIIGEPKEIAALVLAVQERQVQSNLVRRRVIEDSGEADHVMTANQTVRSLSSSEFGAVGAHTMQAERYK